MSPADPHLATHQGPGERALAAAELRHVEPGASDHRDPRCRAVGDGHLAATERQRHREPAIGGL